MNGVKWFCPKNCFWVRFDLKLTYSLPFSSEMGSVFFPWPIEVSKTAQLGTETSQNLAISGAATKLYQKWKTKSPSPIDFKKGNTSYGLELPSPGPQDAGSSPPGVWSIFRIGESQAKPTHLWQESWGPGGRFTYSDPLFLFSVWKIKHLKGRLELKLCQKKWQTWCPQGADRYSIWWFFPFKKNAKNAMGFTDVYFTDPYFIWSYLEHI